MKRLCVFAHWDRDNIIDDYVIYYLNALKEVCSTIIFVSDCNLESNEIAKLNGITDYVLAQKHNEYDFGSYKRGFLLAKKLNLDFDELIFANDSCYGPFFPLTEILNTKGKEKQGDFRGISCWDYIPIKKNGIYTLQKCDTHIQSYFMLFNKNVYTSTVFNNFIYKIKQLSNKYEVIREYEAGLSKVLINAGFTSAVLYKNIEPKSKKPQNCAIERIKEQHFPFFKTAILKSEYISDTEIIKISDQISKLTQYNTDLIIRHLTRIRRNIKPPNLYRKIRYKILGNCNYKIKYFVILAEKSIFKFLNVLFFKKLQKF